MSNVTVRAYEPRDDEAFRHVRAMTFRGGESVQPDEKLLREDCLAYVGELNGKIVAATTVIDMTATLGEQALRCAGLAAVAVGAEERRRWIGGAPVEDIFPFLRAVGFAPASPFPFLARYLPDIEYSSFCTRDQPSR